MTETKTLEILEVTNAMKSLPAEKVTEVKDFVMFLQEKYSKQEIVDESDEWTDEDLNDFALASFSYFEQTEQKDEVTK